MKDHYHLSDVEYNALLKRGVTVADLIRERRRFSINYAENEVTCLALMFYIDGHGDFNKPVVKKKHQKIALAVFSSMNSTDKISIYQYLEDHKNNFKDEATEETKPDEKGKDIYSDIETVSWKSRGKKR